MRDDSSPGKAQPTILVVDDEPALLKLMVSRLQRLGWNVHGAPDASTAIQIAEQLHCGLNVLLTDMQMPGMPGDILIHHIRKVCPYVDVLAMTGAMPNGSTVLPNVPLLRKPFAMDYMVGAIQEILAAQL